MKSWTIDEGCRTQTAGMKKKNSPNLSHLPEFSNIHEINNDLCLT